MRGKETLPAFSRRRKPRTISRSMKPGACKDSRPEKIRSSMRRPAEVCSSQSSAAQASRTITSLLRSLPDRAWVPSAPPVRVARYRSELHRAATVQTLPQLEKRWPLKDFLDFLFKISRDRHLEDCRARFYATAHDVGHADLDQFLHHTGSMVIEQCIFQPRR